MRLLDVIRKNKLITIVALVYFLLFIFSKERAVQSLQNSLYYLAEMVQILPVIFLLTAVIEALIPKEVIVQRLGEKAGISGNILSLILGSVSAGPIYAAFPISKALLSKGASISNIVIILSAWAVVKVPMLLNEAKFLGFPFMGVRWILTVIGIFVMAAITSKIVKKEDLPIEKGTIEQGLSINEHYCIGCGLCVKISPSIFELKNGKARIYREPSSLEDHTLIQQSLVKCPTNAISLHKWFEKINTMET